MNIDWNEAWADEQLNHRHHHDSGSEYWDSQADRFATFSMSDYVIEFIRLLDLQEGETVLDMGCGTGALAIPLAKAGHPVVAADFSPRMLEHLETAAKEEHLDNIRMVHGGWEDDWDKLGIGQVDVAFSSRSLVVMDLRSAFEKLERAARRRVCVTLPGSDSPRHDMKLTDYLGRDKSRTANFVFAFNVLVQMGRYPEVTYIVSWKDATYQTLEDARADLLEPLGDLTPQEQVLFDRFCEEHLIRVSDKDGAVAWKRDYKQPIRWAFISWDKNLEEHAR